MVFVEFLLLGFQIIDDAFEVEVLLHLFVTYLKDSGELLILVTSKTEATKAYRWIVFNISPWEANVFEIKEAIWICKFGEFIHLIKHLHYFGSGRKANVVSKK